MNLAAGQFSYVDSNIEAEFKVTDGWLKIEPKEEPKTFTISYDLNGGTCDGRQGVLKFDYPEGTAITILKAPTRAGCTFQYWKGSKYMPGDQYKVTEDHTFVAQWKKSDPDVPSGDDDPDQPSGDDDPDQSSGDDDSEQSSTGDNSRPGLYTILLIASLMGIAAIACGRIRRNKGC